MESKEFIPSRKLLRKGIPITGIAVRETIFLEDVLSLFQLQ
jgi:hypothetical protein